jgi:hypothetical protein
VSEALREVNESIIVRFEQMSQFKHVFEYANAHVNDQVELITLQLS